MRDVQGGYKMVLGWLKVQLFYLARNASGLARILEDVKADYRGGVTRGQRAKAIAQKLGISAPQGINVQVFDLSEMQVVDKTYRQRAFAAKALGRLSSPDNYDALVRALNDRHPTVRNAVVQALCRIGGDKMQEALGNMHKLAGFSIMASAEKARRILRGL